MKSVATGLGHVNSCRLPGLDPRDIRKQHIMTVQFVHHFLHLFHAFTNQFFGYRLKCQRIF